MIDCNHSIFFSILLFFCLLLFACTQLYDIKYSYLMPIISIYMYSFKYSYLILIIYTQYHHHHHHVVPPARISLTLSRHFFLSFITSSRSSGLHPVSSHSCCMYVWAGHPAFARPYVGSIGVHHLWARPCFSSSVLHVWFV